MFGRLVFIACSALSVGVFACSGTSNDSPTNPGGGSGSTTGAPASADQVASCKESCNKMKFFGCNSAEEQAACYDQCGSASPSQIELFNACATTSICDPACRTNITPKPAPGAPAPTGGGATSSSCATACDKLVSCSFVKVGDKAGCVSACETNAYQYQIDCVNNNACDKLASACGGGGGEGAGPTPDAGSDDTLSIAECQNDCDQLHFMECIEATDQSACRATCTSATGAKRESFTACMRTSTGECTSENACYDAFQN